MSIEYTIDIQLTELGYPDILQTSLRETPYSATSPDDSFPPSHTPSSLSTTHVQRLVKAGKEAGAAKQTSHAEETTAPLSDTCTTQHPAQGPEATDLPLLIAEEDDCEDDDKKGVDDGDAAPEESTEMQYVEDESDNSEVSDVYEEEEVDEDDDDDDEEEEGLNDGGDYRCSVCDLQLPSKFKLQDHMNLHTGARPYSCAECGKRFCQTDNYRVHLRTHAQNEVVSFRCRVCLKSFKTQRDLKVHLSRTHLEKEFYECDLCKRVFTCLTACEYHVKKCRLEVVCEVCGRNFCSLKSLARHRKMTCLRNFKCTDCTKTFTKKNALLKHSFSHLGLLPYTCVRCHCHYRLANLYRKHKCEPERIHCVACLREFLSQKDFQRHKKDTGCWGNQEPKGDEIRCLECGERFDTSEELKKHAGAHQRVLKCAECGKGFRSALLLMSHMGGHAGNSPCLCQSCGLGFPHQQNYDSHLKTCGQKPKPSSAPKKRLASKSSKNAKPDSALPTNTAAMPAAVSNNPAAPVKDSRGPELVTGGVSAGSGQSDGVWQLTLNQQPPPGVNLVVFLPVSATQTDCRTPTSAISPTCPAVQGPPKEAPPPVSHEQLGVHAALGAMQNGPLNLVRGSKRYPVCEAPLDLSSKCNSSKSTLSNIPLLPIKSEPGELDLSGEANSTDRPAFKNISSKVFVKKDLGETDANTEWKQLKVDPMDLSSSKGKTASSGLIVALKKERPSAGVDPWSSRCCPLTEKEIKMEVDIAEEK
ncbi:hypothetical protein VZT92_027098 [Zoarces viviparus]|uniref:C2H2-type domain-containing protein n=1 Tax=Zoarces viviparus TaxID=48416 RepID=A0AAW1DUW5_ZOAVI